MLRWTRSAYSVWYGMVYGMVVVEEHVCTRGRILKFTKQNYLRWLRHRSNSSWISLILNPPPGHGTRWLMTYQTRSTGESEFHAKFGWQNLFVKVPEADCSPKDCHSDTNQPIKSLWPHRLYGFELPPYSMKESSRRAEISFKAIITQVLYPHNNKSKPQDCCCRLRRLTSHKFANQVFFSKTTYQNDIAET